MDLGGTNIKTGVVDDLGRTVAWLSVPTQVPDGAEAAVKRMADSIRQALQQTQVSPDQVLGVGLGAPGTMDVPAGMLLKPLNLKGWDRFPIRDRLRELCGFPVTFANDANAAAYGEYWLGSGKDYPSLALFTLGTGVGGGVILGDSAIDGQNSHGAELGHLTINYDDDARQCSCGQFGHVESYAGATAVIARAQNALNAGRESSLQNDLADGAELTPKLLAGHAENGDELSLEIILETARCLALGIVDVMHVIDPAAVIIGGAMTFGRDQTHVGRRFLARVKEVVLQRTFPVLAERIIVQYASLGSDAGYIGAAGLARFACRPQSSA
ncbi:MAG: ROK family protein [Planctomycetales bacterium]